MTAIDFLLGLNKLGKINLVGIDGAISHDGVSLAVDVNNSQSRIIDFRNLFVQTQDEFGLIISKDELMTERGEVVKLKDVFSLIKEDTRKIKPALYDFVDLQNCFNGDAVITIGHAKNKSEYKNMRGMVKEIKDNYYVVVVGGQQIKVPSICLKRVPRTIMSKTMKEIYEYMLNKGRKPVILPECNYMDVSDCGKFIKYIATDRLTRFESKFWDKDLRDKLGTQKKIRGVLKALFDCSDDEMDAVIMLYGNSDIMVEVLTGKDVLKAYDSRENSSGGSLGNSCMMGKPSNYFEIYEDNAEIAVVRDSDGKIVLRAVMWELYSDSAKKKVKIMDRIYSKNDSMIPMLQGWAIKNGYHTVGTQSHSQREMVDMKGASKPIGDFHVKLKKSNYEKLPYIDTFFYIVGNKAYSSGFILNAHSTSGEASKI